MIPSGLTLAPNALVWLVPGALVLAVLAVWAYRRIAPSLKPSSRSLLIGLRAAILVLVAFLIARPLLSLAGDAAGKGVVVVLTDVSRSMDLPADSIGGARARTRGAEAGEETKRVVRALSGRYRVVERSFAGALLPAAQPDSALDRAVPGARERTAIGDALPGSLAGIENARGVVVISDGAVTSGADPVRAARELGLPVATVAIGETPAHDVAVLDVLSNPTSRVGESTPVEVRMRALGAARRTKVELVDGDKVLASEEVSLPGGGAEVTKRLTFRPTRAGLSVFEVRTPAAPDEWSAGDNRRAFAQEILPDKQKVLVVSGSYHWDWTWIARAIAADSAYKADQRVFARGGFDKPLPASAALLRPYALCVLVGVDDGAIPPATLAAFADYLNAGGSLVLVGGAARAGVLALTPTRLGAALRLARAEGGMALPEATVALTQAGRSSDLMRLDDDAATNSALWGSFAPIANVVPVAASGDDQVYATDVSGRSPVVFERRVGRGRALFLNGGGTYRWGFSGSDTDASRRYERLWGNVLRAMGEPAQTEPLRLVPERPLVARGEPVRLSAALQDAAFRPLDGARIETKITGPVTRTLPLPGAGQGGYGASLEGLPPGRYEATATATLRGRAVGSARATFWVDPQSAEWQDTAPDPGLLAAVARASGGVAVTRGKEGSIAPALAAARPRTGRERAVRLWESPYVFALATALLTTEWWMRRRRGLA
jgi:hypothetical protein